MNAAQQQPIICSAQPNCMRSLTLVRVLFLSTWLIAAPPCSSSLEFKPFKPSDPSLFPSKAYGGEAGKEGNFQRSESAVRKELLYWLERQSESSAITRSDAKKAARMFDNEKVRGQFSNNSGFHAKLLAAALLLNGTIARPARDALFSDENSTRFPATVLFTNLGRTALAKTAVIFDEATQRATWLILINGSPNNLKMMGEPLPVLTATLAHEACHQDNEQGQPEEITAKWIETVVWAQFLLIDPKLAGAASPVVKMLDLELLLWLNSGANFPKPGLKDMPRNFWPAAPGARDLPFASYEQFIRERLYPTIPAQNTTANSYISEVIGRPVRRFDECLILELDACSPLPDRGLNMLPRILRLVAIRGAAESHGLTIYPGPPCQ